MVRRPGLPVINGLPPAHQAAMNGIRERLEIISGDRGKRIELLSADASLSDVISTVNALVTLLQR